MEESLAAGGVPSWGVQTLVRRWEVLAVSAAQRQAGAVFTADFDYHLPEELIAAQPLPERAASRMMVIHRETGVVEHRSFKDLQDYKREGDLWVLNNTRVDRARFYSADGRREVLRTEMITPLRWRCMVRPGRKFRVGDEVEMGGVKGRVLEFLPSGERIIEWEAEIDEEVHGHLPLPHYMNRDDEDMDRERYQTVYSDHSERGSIAAPTAGLHFTPEVLQQLPHAFVTLQVGAGTFLPVKAERVTDHRMHTEKYKVTARTAAAVQAAQRVIAVGTTACRTLESVAQRYAGQVQADVGSTDIFIYPGYRFLTISGLLTNFHLPKSSLIMLVSALAGKELIMKAYQEAVEQRYRFFSYGDCMLII
jgi:S-adenosylmethionine:tRNA ribosyltransferase-isomerase